jgi:hypothetical protein
MHNPAEPDVCTNPCHCNAFANKWSEEEVQKRFDAILSDEALKKKAFPELWAYEWVLSKTVFEAKKSPKGITSRVLVWCISFLEYLLKLVSDKKEILSGGSDAQT